MEVSSRLTLDDLVSRLLSMLGDKGLDELSTMETAEVKELVSSYQVIPSFKVFVKERRFLS